MGRLAHPSYYGNSHRLMFHFSRINILLLPIEIILLLYIVLLWRQYLLVLKYNPRSHVHFYDTLPGSTVPTDCRTIGHLKIRSRPGLMSRERIHDCTDRTCDDHYSPGSVSQICTCNRGFYFRTYKYWRHSRTIVE